MILTKEATSSSEENSVFANVVEVFVRPGFGKIRTDTNKFYNFKVRLFSEKYSTLKWNTIVLFWLLKTL